MLPSPGVIPLATTAGCVVSAQRRKPSIIFDVLAPSSVRLSAPRSPIVRMIVEDVGSTGAIAPVRFLRLPAARPLFLNFLRGGFRVRLLTPRRVRLCGVAIGR